ncbi:NAD-aldehyde dehydrogenase [Pisolithus orientalis]|uniref:NAD-aldehyde dehydrogenase n=1 Tax=Pisolithus orientalis TaxID=936130 RepID=UPI00222498D2|nr:NAD-aldehyde dehydrogenase [Pisolithus orientalis]KAI6015197.1 NAD-aldehyde dehydrogenase [Pisolithus orientalis]
MLLRKAVVSVRHVRCVRGLSSRASNILGALDIPNSYEVPGVYDGRWKGSGKTLESVCPTTGEVLARVRSATPDELREALEKSKDAHIILRKIPAPNRGEILRQIREALAAKSDVLGALVSLEMGKIKTEGVGEVQEFVDICDYAVGLSRMMNGRVMASERPGHTILEVPNPLGVVGVLTAFNFPVAVYGWNFSLSFAAGNANVWKPSPSTPLCSIAVTKIIAQVLEKNGIPGAASALVSGGKDVGEALVGSPDIPLVSFTGSEAVGRVVGKAVQSRFGKTILELGGNNASIVMPDADLSMAVPAVFFGAVGTAGQRYIASRFLDALQKLYALLRVGDPLVEGTLLGPLHTRAAVGTYAEAVRQLREHGARILTGVELRQGNFVQPTIAIPKHVDPADAIWSTETLWTQNMRNIGKWIGPEGSDTGIVNVNVGTSGAEIGAAFGGNKLFPDNSLLYRGRESGGDAWKQYVRWSACTINFSDAAPLAQGVDFST